MALRIVFMGTPDFAVPSLRALHESEHEIVGVITATDKLGGRGKKQVIQSAVKKYAESEGLRILQPRNLKAPEFVEELCSLKADLQVVVAFRMLPVVVWDMPPMGTLNLHGSLLPKYRGAAPIHWAVINGETETGVTTFLLKHEIDTGDLLLQKTMSIGPDETTGDIHDRMMAIGAEAVLETVNGLESGTLIPTPQPDTGITKAPKLHHDTCQLNFDQGAQAVHNFIRGLSPFPAAWTMIDDKLWKFLRSRIVKDIPQLSPGELLVRNQQLFVGTKSYPLEILELQMEGKRRMDTASLLNGYKIQSRNVESA